MTCKKLKHNDVESRLTDMHPHILLIQRASSSILTKTIPTNWYDMLTPDQDQFLESHAVETKKGYHAQGLWEIIVGIANDMEWLLDTVHSGLINMAINCQLDSDLTTLDMDEVLTHSMRDTQEVVNGKYN